MPTEVHQHYDANDQLTGYTVVTRESAWDADTRGRALRLQEYEDSICGCGCGLPVAVAQQPRPFKVDKFTCYAGRALQQTRDAEAEQAKRDKRPDSWSHGVHYYVVPHDTDDD